jgi:alkyl sulfatase BDS1-like metallo-beta-lactamase superfamily hydrolase
MGKEATKYTIGARQSYLDYLPFENRNDYANARRGLIKEARDLIVKDESGRVVWQMNEYQKTLAKEAPDTANPSLWRHEQLDSIAGLFEVTKGIYQVRGFDLASMTIVCGKTGYIIIDALGSVEVAKAAIDFAFGELGKKPIKAAIITHSHWDHFGGIGGIISSEEVEGGKVLLVAPDGFTEELVSENVFVGRAMNRRAIYQFGSHLEINETAHIGCGLGKGASSGVSAPLKPNRLVKKTGEKMTVDGVRFVFQMTPDAEAPAEMCFFLPDFKTLCLAEIVTYHQHNILPFRGAKARSAKGWAAHIDEALTLFGKRSETMFITHHYPCWGNKNIIDLLEKQRDLYKFINDQTARLINKGLTMSEIAEEITLPDTLSREFFCRGYYGSLSHNVKATYQRYIGWFDANPAHLWTLPPEVSGIKYVEYMGGVDKLLEQAKKSYEKGEYRWVAEVLYHAVFAYPDNVEVKALQADAFEQLGYQSESAAWRNLYLTGAAELRYGVKNAPALSTMSPAVVEFMPTITLFDYLAVQIDPQKANEKKIAVNIRIKESGERYILNLSNGVLSCRRGSKTDCAAAYIIKRSTLNDIALYRTDIAKEIANKNVKVSSGDPLALNAILLCLDELPDKWFNIVTP